MRRPRQEVLDEGRNVRRRNERWTFNLFNRPFWRPFGGAQRPQPQQRQQVVPYPPEFPVAVEAGPVEDVDAEDNEIDGNGKRAADARVTEFSTAGGTNIVLDPVNANRRPAAWLHQWIGGVLPRSLRNNQHRVVTANRDIYDIEFVGNTLGLHLRQSKRRQEIVVHGISPDNAHKDTIQVGDVVVAIGTVNVATLPELTTTNRFEQVKKLIVQSDRPVTIKFLRQTPQAPIPVSTTAATTTTLPPPVATTAPKHGPPPPVPAVKLDPIVTRLHEKIKQELRLEFETNTQGKMAAKKTKPAAAAIARSVVVGTDQIAREAKKETDRAKKIKIVLQKAAAETASDNLIEIKVDKIIKKFYQFYKDYENEEYNRVKAKVSDLC